MVKEMEVTLSILSCYSLASLGPYIFAQGWTDKNFMGTDSYEEAEL